MEERHLRAAALLEWMAAALCVIGLLWIISVPIVRFLGPGVQAAIADADVNNQTPPGVPAGATTVPVMLLVDGGEIRQGDLRSKVDQMIPARLAAGPPVVSSSHFGERHTQAYVINGAKLYVVCERAEPNGEMKVSGIYLP